MKKNIYHSLTVDKVFTLLNVKSDGLSEKEAILRLEKFGPNKLPDDKKLSAVILFFHQFKNPLIYILFAALIISFATKHFIDGWIIGAVIMISAIVGFLQEYKASKALSKLQSMVQYKAKVLRDSKEIVVMQENILPGDIIFLSPGDKVPADARLIDIQNFEVIEAALTGESVPSNKQLGILPESTSIANRENMIFMGTVVASGNARAVVTETGECTELGKVAMLVKETKDEKTPLQKQMAHFGKFIALLLIALNILIFGLGILVGKPFFEMFLTAVAVIVAAIPEGLLTAMAIILAVGMQRLAKHKGLVRKMIAAETLGSVSVICSDKTGTLTEGKMRVTGIITKHDILGNQNSGGIPLEDITEYGDEKYVLALKIGLLCNNTVIENPKEKLKNWIMLGNPTDNALFLAGHASGLSKEKIESEEKRISEIPFDAEYKFMATMHESNQGKIVYVKGAPEKILNISTLVDVGGKNSSLTKTKKALIKKQHEHLTSSGLRVLAVAYKKNNTNKFTKENLGNLVFVGLIALKDPLRVEAKKTIEEIANAGIRTVIITGDHKLTAIAIVSELGISVNKQNVLEGSDLDILTDLELQEKVKITTIFARVEPLHKIRIIEAFQANGEVVAMTGDGVNDAPALKKADIGVAVGSGTDVAKDVADLVLLDDNFETIVEAIKRGRMTFNNIRKVMLYLLGFSFSEMIIITGSIIAGFPLAMLPAQILWINLIQDAAPAMSLAFDEIDEDVMKEKPRKKTEPLLNHSLKKLLAFYIIIMNTILFGLFYYFWKVSGDIDYTRTIVFASLVVTSIFYIYSVRGMKVSILKLNPFSNKFLTMTTVGGIILLLVAIYTPFFNAVLHTVRLGIKEWLILICYAMLSIVVYEIGKKFTIAKKFE